MTDPTPHRDPHEAQAVLDGSSASLVTDAPPKHKPRLADPYGLRALVLGWCMWLLISWSITLAIGATAHAVRWVVFSALVGLMGVWPALRLSQQMPGPAGATAAEPGHEDRASAPKRVLATGLDWVCLMGVFQVVVWPLMVVGGWSIQQTLWLDVAIGAWSALTGVLLGLGRIVPVPGARSLAMMLCMLLVVGEPALMSLLGYRPGSVFGNGGPSGGHSGGGGEGMLVSPVQAVWELTTTVQPSDPWSWLPTLLSVLTAAVLGWVLLWGVALTRHDGRE